MLKAVSLTAPFPHAIAAGIKTAETRDHPPAGDMCPPGVRPQPGARINRGDRIAIHCTEKATGFGKIGTRTRRGSWEIERDQAGLIARGADLEWPWRLAQGVFVATAVVVDALPIVAPSDCDWYEDRPRDSRCAHAAIDDQVIWHTDDPDARYHTTIRVEQSWGDYTPGRWAWILDDVRRLPAVDQIACPGCIDPAHGRPRHMHQGVWTVPPAIAPRLLGDHP